MKADLLEQLSALDTFPEILAALFTAAYTGQVIIQLHCGRPQHVDLPQPPVRVEMERRQRERRSKSPTGA
jgi:hypothetical protein